MTTPHARRSLKAYSCFICPIAAFSATSSTRFFGSPTAMLPCPDSDPLPASSVACSRLATASLPAPGSHPSRRTCVSPAPHPPPLAPLRPASRRRSSALPCACSETCLFPFLSLKSYSISCGVRGHIWTHPACKSLLDVARENETRTYIRPLSEEWVAPRAPMESALLLLIRSTASNCGPAPSGSEDAGLSHLRHLRRLKHLDEIDPKTRRRGRWKSGKRKGFSKLAKQASFPRPENSASPHSQAVVCTLSRHTVVLPHVLSATTQCGRSCLRPLRKPSSFLVFVVCQQSRRCEHLSCGMLGTLPIALRE